MQTVLQTRPQAKPSGLPSQMAAGCVKWVINANEGTTYLFVSLTTCVCVCEYALAHPQGSFRKRALSVLHMLPRN